MRYAGNDLACQSCHLNAGLQPFAAPFVSTFATFPMLVDDQVLTLHDRINGCMTRSMNGKPLPDESKEMEALIAYIRFVGKGSPQGVRVGGMGLRPLRMPTNPPDARRGAEVYAKFCAECHKADGQGERKTGGSGVGYNITTSRRSGARRASMPARAWPRPLMPPPISTTTCLTASTTRSRF
jgi:thiosulfate dehydrogenase